MSGKTIKILENFDPDKNYKIHIRKQIISVLSKLEKSSCQCLYWFYFIFRAKMAFGFYAWLTYCPYRGVISTFSRLVSDSIFWLVSFITLVHCGIYLVCCFIFNMITSVMFCKVIMSYLSFCLYINEITRICR